jgi:hypothetical protein
MLIALQAGKITEGHARPLMMLNDRAQEQNTLYKEILFKKLTVREAEQIARGIALERTRKKAPADPEIDKLGKELAETLGTKVSIERKSVGGKIVIDFFSTDDLRAILDKVHLSEQIGQLRSIREVQVDKKNEIDALNIATPIELSATVDAPEEVVHMIDQDSLLRRPYDDRSSSERKEDENSDHALSNFTI